MTPLSRDAQARMVALHLPQEGFVNLGIGAPTHVADYLPEGSGVILHSENGVLNVGPKPAAGEEDWNLINAGKMPISLRTGGSYFDSSLSFAMMRGGHLDVAVLGAFQVSKDGDLANWTTGDNGSPPGIGGAIDLAVGAKSIWVMMDHTTKDGRSRIVERFGYPLTARRVVTRIFTSLAIIDVAEGGLAVRALLDGLTIEALRDRTEAPLHVAREILTIRQDGSVA